MSKAIKKQYENLFYPRVKKTIDAKFDETAAIAKSRGVQSAINSLNNDLTNPELTKEIQRLYTTVGNRFATDTQKSLKIQERGLKKPQKDFIGYDSLELKANKTWVDWILNYLREHLFQKVLYTVNQTTREHLLLVLNKAVEEGLGIDETVELINKDTFSETQAARIVRTEINIASNAGTLAAGETYEYQVQKTWIAVHDFRTRGNNPDDDASHVQLDKTTIDFEDFFVDKRNGDRLKSPGDPKASGASIINCRCQLGLQPKKDINGRLIPKRKTTSVIFPNQNRTQRTILI